MMQYRRERTLLSNCLVAKGVVADLRKPFNSRSGFLNFIFSRFSANIPLIKYSFVAFDEKTYVGETG